MSTEPPPQVDLHTLTWLLGAIAAVGLFLTSAGRFLLGLWRGGSTAVRRSDLSEWVVQRVRGTGTGIPKLGERPEGGTILFELAEHAESIASLGHSDLAQSDRLALLEAKTHVLLLLRGVPVDAPLNRYRQLAAEMEEHDWESNTGQWVAIRDGVMRQPPELAPRIATPPAGVPHHQELPVPRPRPNGRWSGGGPAE